MDDFDFVRDKLTEWNLGKWIQIFKDQGIDKESLYLLRDQEIADLIPTVGPRVKFQMRLELLKKEPNNQKTVDSNKVSISKTHVHVHRQVCMSTSGTSDKEKKRLFEVKQIMRCVRQKIPHQDNKLNRFLRRQICDLETDKREMVGVFGKTGAGKSSLINAVIGVKNLLPSGSISACTSVMIKVEANMENSKYEADIEFITKEEWIDELWFFLRGNADQESDQKDDDDHQDIVEKLSALYGEEWKNKSPEDLMDGRYFKEIPEFLLDKRKMLTCETAKGLSAKLVIYTKCDPKDGEVKRCYWPLVKCVTIRVPNNDLLKHVTLVDLPGNGDRNKSRDMMWKTIVGSCSTVWIVTDINRAASEPEAWGILKSACSFMGNAGQCRQIHFICTKSDLIEDSESHSPTDACAFILKTNNQAKKQVRKEFSKLNKVTKYFSDESFKVFTVSSKEYLRKKLLYPVDTEIPKLQEYLQGLNDRHSVTLNYVSGALGILSLIQGARLTDGNKSGSGFHSTLKCIVQHNGTHKPKKKKQINLNMKLSSCLTESVDEKFKKTFPNEGEGGQFNGVLNLFSLDTKMMRKKPEYKDVELQLKFLKTEEKKIKAKLNKIIRERKKTIYSSLTATIETSMQPCYDAAKEIKGAGSLNNIRSIIEEHVRESKDVMFQKAKAVMLSQLKDLMREILKELKETMQESIELSLKTDGISIPDVTSELEMVKKHYKELKPR
ncbi:nuclear GTPase SLIP-GC-like [Clinocottus analis]|uniref:nuclear GTPase SLIP-GC-like n=1 Tax=Clinocottus analis TaxID=304258 RepID=UPI0035C03B05